MPTYTPLQSITLTSAASTVTFSNISQTYQDLQLVVSSPTSTGNDSFLVRINGDTGTTYSNTTLDGNGSSATSRRRTGLTYIVLQENGGASDAILKTNFMNYSSTSIYKTVIGTATQGSGGLSAHVGLWRNTAAISSLTLFLASSLTYAAGTTFDLYGISPVAAQNASATGGTDIFYDSTYVYHVFKGSGTFTPARALTAEVLTVAGGGGGGGARNGDAGAGGGGAGGLLYHSSKSLTSGTAYTVTVGAGGVGGANDLSNYTAGTNGSNSVFDTMTANGGGGGGQSRGNGLAGGSGGGSGSEGGISGGTANQGTSGGATGYGNNGGTGTGSGNAGGAGGGGAGAAGTSGVNSTSAGAGGNGLNTWSTWATVTGTGDSGYYAGGGSGGSYSTRTTPAGGLGGGGRGGNNTGSQKATSGMTNTGGGGGGAGDQSPNAGAMGGSGIVIVRYAR
jgi:hypothetical protein